MRRAACLALVIVGWFAFAGTAPADVMFSPIEIQAEHPFEHLPAVSTKNAMQLALPIEVQLGDGHVQRGVRLVTVGSMEGKTYAVDKPAELASLNKLLLEGVFTPGNLAMIQPAAPTVPGRLPSRGVIVVSASGKNAEMIYLPITTGGSKHSTELTWLALKVPDGARVDLAPFE